MSRPAKKRCKDCGPDSKRPAPFPGPRCATHHRAFRSRQKAAQHDKRVQQTYGLAPGEYGRLYEFQDGLCFICRRANGTVRKLAVDHDHKHCKDLPACGKCVRGLLCKTCNRMLGHLRDDPEAFTRAAEYLRNPPIRRMRDGDASRS